jgi:L-arabinose isomerase
MDFMNLNQAAHGDREAGSSTRACACRKIVVGHWQDPEVQERLGAWMRVARAWQDLAGGEVRRFGDNMRRSPSPRATRSPPRSGSATRSTATASATWSERRDVADAAVTRLCAEYEERYTVAPRCARAARATPRCATPRGSSSACAAFLEGADFKGFTTTFEDLHGLRQLPGLAVQRLMAEGYGFGAEGDWKTCALLRAMKVIGAGLPGGTSFMEDYTYHLHPSGSLVLGAHMLEVCESIAGRQAVARGPPARDRRQGGPRAPGLHAPAGPALNASLIDLGNRFRLIVNEVDVVRPPKPLPKLPVARAVWKCRPDFKTACGAWIRPAARTTPASATR